MQDWVIAGAFLGALVLPAIAQWRKLPPKRWVVFSFLLFCLGAYECYMSFFWERHVHAPIRLDLFAEIALLVLLLVLGMLSCLQGNKS